MNHQPARLDPPFDGLDLPPDLPDMRYRTEPHRTIVRRTPSHAGASGFHLLAAPCVHSPLWMRLQQPLNNRRCQGIAAGLEGREENDRPC